MGFFSGNLSLKRFFIEEIEYFKDKERVVANLNNYLFKDIENQAKEESIGWVSPLKVYKSQIDVEEIYYGNYILLALRYDTKKVSKVLIDCKLNETIEREGLSIQNNKQLKQLKDDIKQELLKKTLPSPKIVEAVIDLNKKTLLLNSTSKKLGGLFLSLFEKSFSIMPVYVDPTVFSYISVGKQGVEKLSSLTETVIYDE
ncbi:conserved hypothetical protein [Thermotomaculum hydrothermale]|uniref:Recombination-associated protein RdgC n=1 Tax=Thermotomaculum hydrothermale TaxID=981385 RepID=A0A7R6PEG9_9BACT|nr:recombination-associated protein RdgC [Thermotomaculum hydrothermale]BBB32208.1 conserved hypothetical protein [Thermotomaculum hydrothermale]